MNNLIDEVFSTDNKIKIMTHVVAGYPDLEASKSLIKLMAESGADLVEVQIPFSDPLADGPTIMAANQKALDNGVTPDDCFEMAAEIKEAVSIPILLMTYVNIPFQMGMENFVESSAESGISGLIIPDIPFDEDNNEYITSAVKYGIYPVQVVSPDVSIKRLERIVKVSGGFIYTTLKVGITGARRQIENRGLEFIHQIRRLTNMPIAAGFGISSADHIKQLQGIADAAVIGSHMINLFNREGIKAVGDFIKTCKNI